MRATRPDSRPATDLGAAAWINRFLKGLIRRFQPHDWPEAGTEDHEDLRREWAGSFDRRRVTEEEAMAVLALLREDPPQWHRDYLPKILESLKTLRADRATTAGLIAKAADATDCEHCAGTGLVSVRHKDAAGADMMEIDREIGDGEVVRRRVSSWAAAHCVCPTGRDMRRKTDAAELRRFPDLARVLSGRSVWELGVVAQGSVEAMPPGGWRELFRRMASQSRVPAVLGREAERKADEMSTQRRNALTARIREALKDGPCAWTVLVGRIKVECSDGELRLAAASIPVLVSYAGDREIWDMARGD